MNGSRTVIVTVEVEVDRDDLSRNDVWQPEAWNFDSLNHADSLGLVYGYEITSIKEAVREYPVTNDRRAGP